MSWSNIATVYLKELRDSLRDKRTLLSTIIIPTIVMPVLTFGVIRVGTKAFASARGEIPSVMVVGGEDSPAVIAALKRSPKLQLLPARDDYRQQIVEKKVRAVALVPAGFAAGLAAGSAPPVVILHYQGELKSGFGADELDRAFRDLRDKNVAASLVSHGLPATLIKPFEITRQNVAPPEKVGGSLFGGVVPYLIIILCFTGAMYPAIDLSAGEKERGTLETLLCSPASRREIVLGKFLMVLTGSLSAMLMSLLSMGVTAMASGLMLVGGARGGAAVAAQTKVAIGFMPQIDPVGILGVLAMVLPIAVLFSAVEFTVALFARSSKEAQSYLGPGMFLVLVPAIVGMLPGIELDARLALVPLLNLSLVCKEMLSGVWHWHYIALIFGSSCVYAAAALAMAVKMFNREEVLFRA